MKTKLAILVVVIFTAALFLAASPALAAPGAGTMGGSCNSHLCQTGGAVSPCCLQSANPLYDCLLGSSPAGSVSLSSRPIPDIKLIGCSIQATSGEVSQNEPLCSPESITSPPAPAGDLNRCRNCLSSEDPLSLP